MMVSRVVFSEENFLINLWSLEPDDPAPIICPICGTQCDTLFKSRILDGYNGIIGCDECIVEATDYEI